jgi:predicted ribosome quality control (RQC) complex YloA/Tae2 family protein
MSLDSLNARALVLELRPLLGDSRVQKFSQLSELDFLMHLRSPGRTDKLLFSLHPERSRFHLLPDAHPPAIVPSSFVMLGRKHFGGCRLTGIDQPALERSLELTFSSGYRLVFDWAGRPSSLLILAPESGLVAGAYPFKGRFVIRQPYQLVDGSSLPPACELSGGDLAEKVSAIAEQPALVQAINQVCKGLPPLWLKRLAADATGKESLAVRWDEIMDPLRGGDPSRLVPGLEKDGELSYRQAVVRPFASMSLAAAERWAESTQAPGVPDHRSELLRTLRKGRDKSSRKMDKRQKDKTGAESAPRDQLFGDLLLAYATTIPGRAPEFRTKDWEGRPVTIPLEPHLTATENAERYYARGKKKKRALAVLDEQLALAAEEIAFWDELIFAAEGAENRTDLEEVRRAIPGSRHQGKIKRAPQAPSSGPRRFEHNGFQLLVGRNPAQNEKLSLRDAAKDDRWFHVRLGAGSHVILRAAGREPDQATLLAGAWLAATYSRSQGDPRSAVITTLARHLKKPKGGPLGKVTYRAEREMVVDPTSSPPEGLRRLDKKETFS